MTKPAKNPALSVPFLLGFLTGPAILGIVYRLLVA